MAGKENIWQEDGRQGHQHGMDYIISGHFNIARVCMTRSIGVALLDRWYVEVGMVF